MKKLAIIVISMYQLVSPIRGHCRYLPTCSQYAKISIEEHGIAKGSWLGLLRILSCQPFTAQIAKLKSKINIANLKT